MFRVRRRFSMGVACMTDTTSVNMSVPPAKLPVWATVKLAYAAFFGNFGTLLKLALPWLLLVGGLTYLSMSMMVPWQTAALEAMKAEQRPPSQPWQMLAASWSQVLITLIAGAIIAVAWHRLLLLGERPALMLNPVRPAVWRYVGALCAMMLLMAIPLLLFILPAMLFFRPDFLDPSTLGEAHPIAPSPGFIVLMVAGYITTFIVAFYVSSRLMLALPARAVGDNNLNFRTILNRTKGNTWRVIGGLVACSFPAMLLVQVSILSFLEFPKPGIPHGIPNDAQHVFGNLAIMFSVLTAYMLLVSMIYIGFLSYAYRHFFGAR